MMMLAVLDNSSLLFQLQIQATSPLNTSFQNPNFSFRSTLVSQDRLRCFSLQELCLLCGIIKQKIVVYIVVTGPPMMKTTLAATIEKEAGTIITPGVLIFTTITRRNLETMVVPSIFPWPIMPIILAPPTRSDGDASTSAVFKYCCSIFEDDKPVFMSRDEIDRYSPSRKDGIDVHHETHLRYSYCAFLQNLGMRLELPQTIIGTSMVLCHRFFVRRSHACHDRFLIATAALFLAAKSEEAPRPLNNVLRASSEILNKQNFALFSYRLPVDWFEQYRERVFEAEQLILTTLNFELNVQHPYASLTSVLNKLGLSKTVLVNLALNLVSEGLRSSLWLQFKPHHIAAGAAYLAAKFLNIDLTASQNIWQEFQTTPTILQDISQQLMELF